MQFVSLTTHTISLRKVLESAVKNCGRRFHAQVATKDFLGELIKIIGPKNDPPQAVQEKVLSLIQAGCRMSLNSFEFAYVQ